MKEITVDAVIDSVTTVTDFINEQLEAMDCPMKAQMQIDIAIDEVFSNIAYYAYGETNGKATVRFEVNDNPLSVELVFLDNGIAYNPLENEDPDITLTADERKIGGLGVYMVKKTMDEVTYRYENGQNILTIRKNIS